MPKLYDVEATWVYLTPAGDLSAVLVLSEGVTPPESMVIDTRTYELHRIDTQYLRDELRKQASE